MALAKITQVSGTAVHVPGSDIDTDRIIPARFMKCVTFDGLGEFAFYDVRFDKDGKPTGHPLDNPRFQGASILLSGSNFGCGSSREHAPWALLDLGIQVVISTQIADIFRNNALKNGVLPVVVSEDDWQAIAAFQASRIVVDLATQKIELPDGATVDFQIEPFARQCLLKGVDQLGYLLLQEDAIAAFENSRAA